MFEAAYIVWPGVYFELAHSLVCYAVAHPLAIEGEKERYEMGYILSPFAQRGNYQWVGKTKIEVLAKASAVHCAPQIAIGSGYNARFYMQDAARAKRADLATVEHAQESRLDFQGQFAYLVEKDAPRCGGGKEAGLVAGRPCERASFVPE